MMTKSTNNAADLARRTAKPAHGSMKAAFRLRRLVLLGLTVVAWPLLATAAEVEPDQAGMIVNHDAAASRQRSHIQPQAWEFSAPSGSSELSPREAREVDQIYEQLIHGALPRCAPATQTSGEERC